MTFTRRDWRKAQAGESRRDGQAARGANGLRCPGLQENGVRAWRLVLFGLLGSVAILPGACQRVEPATPNPEYEILETRTGAEMVLIPAGSFLMGSDDGEPDEAPPHEVSLAAFWIDRTEVTQEQYGRLVLGNPSHFKGPDRPVEQVSWADAALYCNARSRSEGLQPCYDEETAECDFQASGYRLPTEAEWEYACRAGADMPYAFGADPQQLGHHAWFGNNAGQKTQPVAGKKPNPWGLYDMHGNVAEWCNDVYDGEYYRNSPKDNPRGPADGDKYVLRGGAWNSHAARCRAAARVGEDPGFQDACFARDAIGFRCVRRAGERLTRQPPPPRADANRWLTSVVEFSLRQHLVYPGVEDTQAEKPFVEADVPAFSNRDPHFYRLPGLLVTRRGTLLAASQKRFGARSDFAPSSWVVRRSRDGGRTFQPEQTLFERDGYCTFNGNLVEDRQTETVFACFIAFLQAEHAAWFTKTWIPQGGGFSIVKSTDDGRTWSAPIEVVPKPNAAGWRGGGAFNNNHGIQLRTGPHAGRLVIGARVFKPGVYEGRAKGGLIYSDDHGETWHVGGVPFAEWGDTVGEMTVGETADGEVYVNCRNEVDKFLAQATAVGRSVKRPEGLIAQRRLYARSRDGGETFYAQGCHAELFDGPCNAGQAVYSWAAGGDRGVLLFTAPVNRQRTRLTGYLSRDGGRTWTAGNVISESSGGYADVAVLPDKTILTLYESREGLLLARYNFEWLVRAK